MAVCGQVGVRFFAEVQHGQCRFAVCRHGTILFTDLIADISDVKERLQIECAVKDILVVDRDKISAGHIDIALFEDIFLVGDIDHIDNFYRSGSYS